MTRLSGKVVRERDVSSHKGLGVDFDKPTFEGAIKDKGINVIHEKAYLCPCKDKTNGDHQSVCKNCAGSGWIFANPIKTKMIISAITSDDRYKDGALREWGMLDSGSVRITAYPDDKLSYMDRITVLDAISEHQQVLYPALTDGSDMSNSDSVDDGTLFAATKYDIKAIDFIGLFKGADVVLQRLIEPDDYTYRDNLILFDWKHNSLVDPCITIRYRHNPTYHVVDIPRESMQTYANDARTKLILPNHALGKRAHLIKDAENFDGTRLLDNSWLPTTCEESELTTFYRQLRYTSAQDLLDNLTQTQIVELEMLLEDSDVNALGVNGGILQINP